MVGRDGKATLRRTGACGTAKDVGYLHIVGGCRHGSTAGLRKRRRGGSRASVVDIARYLDHVRGGGVVARRPFLAVARSIVGADPGADNTTLTVVDCAINGAVGRLGPIPATLVIIADIGRVVVRILRADVSGYGVGHAAQIEVAIFADDLTASAHVLARQGLDAANGFAASGMVVAVQGGRGGHGQGLVVAIDAILAHVLRWAGGRVGGGVPTGICADFVIRVEVNGISNLAVGVRDLGGTAEAVHYGRCDQVQAAA